MWADAVCINQADTTAEKPAQFLVMRDMIANASRVIGRLGNDWDSGLAAEMIIHVDSTNVIPLIVVRHVS